MGLVGPGSVDGTCLCVNIAAIVSIFCTENRLVHAVFDNNHKPESAGFRAALAALVDS
jgi:hypothetical protein